MIFSGGEQIHGLYKFSTDKENLHINGICGDGQNEQYILIHWKENNSHNLMNLTFHIDKKSHEYALHRIIFELSAKILPNGTNKILTLHQTEDIFKTPIGMSHHCSKEKTLKLTTSENLNKTVGTVSFTRIFFEAYRTRTDKVFSTAIDCTIFRTPGKIELKYLIVSLLYD